MHSAAVVLAICTLSANALAALIGAWDWRRFEPSRAFWAALRAGQGAAVALAACAGVAAAAGHSPEDGLFWLYAVLPAVVGFLAEQLRPVAAQLELDRRGLADRDAIAALPAGEQNRLVHAILHRELGVMAIAAAIVCFLALRAWGTAAGL